VLIFLVPIECLADEGEGELDRRHAEARNESSESDGVEGVHYKQILKSRAVMLISAFLLSYVGTEVTQGSESLDLLLLSRNLMHSRWT
jgi:hypothetical protein